MDNLINSLTPLEVLLLSVFVLSAPIYLYRVFVNVGSGKRDAGVVGFFGLGAVAACGIAIYIIMIDRVNVVFLAILLGFITFTHLCAFFKQLKNHKYFRGCINLLLTTAAGIAMYVLLAF